jgi:hypothetical protein
MSCHNKSIIVFMISLINSLSIYIFHVNMTRAFLLSSNSNFKRFSSSDDSLWAFLSICSARNIIIELFFWRSRVKLYSTTSSLRAWKRKVSSKRRHFAISNFSRVRVNKNFQLNLDMSSSAIRSKFVEIEKLRKSHFVDAWIEWKQRFLQTFDKHFNQDKIRESFLLSNECITHYSSEKKVNRNHRKKERLFLQRKHRVERVWRAVVDWFCKKIVVRSWSFHQWWSLCSAWNVFDSACVARKKAR